MQLDNRTVVMTGGMGGIGACLAALFRRHGARVTVVDRQEGADIVADLSAETSLAPLCGRLAGMKTDILVNLAGLMYFGHFAAQDPAQLAAMMRVNLEAPMRLAQAVLPQMALRGYGQVVNVGSVFGAIPFPHFVAYSAAKAGLKGFSDSLRREYAGKGVFVTHVAPRAVATPLNSGLIAELHRRTHVASDRPEDVAEKILAAVAARRKNATIGLPETCFSLLNALLPGVVDNALLPKRDAADALLKETLEEKSHAKAA